MSTLENNRSIEDQIDELKVLIETAHADGSVVAEMSYQSRLEMLQEELMSKEKYNPAEKFGGPAYEHSAELSKMIEDGTLEVVQEGMKLPKELKIYASGTGYSKVSNFKRAVSWILHSEELDEVQNRFGLTDQQMEDAVAVVEMFNRIEAGAYQDGLEYIGEAPKFDMLDEVHEWSKK